MTVFYNDQKDFMDVAIIGGGASGFFSAITVKENHPNANVVIFEKSSKVLSKISISGGGRCNVTNGCTSIKELSKSYPRGEKYLQKAFQTFNTKHAFEWFESKGVPLFVQDDNRVFPKSQKSQSIIDCFLNQANKLDVKIKLEHGIKSIIPTNNKLQLEFINREIPTKIFDKVIVATGGSPKREGLAWLEKLNHKIENPVPSLFTFNMPDESVTSLKGIVVDKSIVSIQGTKYKSDGSLLITHWGMSGPAIIKLSSFGARLISEKDYKFNVQVNWINITNNAFVLNELKRVATENANKILANAKPFSLPERLWLFIIEKSELSQNKKWKEVGKNGMNKLVSLLTNNVYSVSGKTTFKDEFVTCGGVSLESVDFSTMQSKTCKNLYFTGEVLDIDGITGGFNFQAAWTTAFIAGKLN